VSATETALTAHLIVAGGHPGDEFLCLVVKELDRDNSSPTLHRHHVAGNVVPAIVVGVFIEAPVMISVVKIVNRTRVWYERKSGSRPTPSAALTPLCHPAADT
jgi:hypothetical protein